MAATKQSLKWDLSKLQTKVGLKPEINQKVKLKKMAKRLKDERNEALEAIKTLKAKQYERKLFHLGKLYKKSVKKAKMFAMQRIVRKIKAAKGLTKKVHESASKEADEEQIQKSVNTMEIAKNLPVDVVASFLFSNIKSAAEDGSLEEFDADSINLSSIETPDDHNKAEYLNLLQTRIWTNKVLREQSAQLFNDIRALHAASLDVTSPVVDESLERKTKRKELKEKKRKAGKEDAPNTPAKKKVDMTDLGEEREERDDEHDESDEENPLFVESLRDATKPAKKTTKKTPSSLQKTSPKKKKNRPGQRQRQGQREKAAKENNSSEGALRRKVPIVAGKARTRESTSPASKRPQQSNNASRPTPNKRGQEDHLHPSWAARVQQKKAQAAAFSTATTPKKIKFNDD